MKRLTRLFIEAGGLALSLVGAGVSAAFDRQKTKKPVDKKQVVEIKPKFRKNWLWPS